MTEARIPYLTAIRPGPSGSGGGPLPEPPPAGILPPEDSKLWVFTAKAVQGGENFIQDDTREWFRDRDGKVQIIREYLDHPRWLASGRDSVRAKMHNAHIVSEIHMLARISQGKPDVPDWVPARMSVKQQQADLAYRLTKFTRDVFIRKGKDALDAFADKAPAQFIKFVGNTFIPKKIEAEMSAPDPTEGLTREQADSILGAIADELKRRQDEARTITITPLDYEAPADIVDAVQDKAEAIHNATEPKMPVGTSKSETAVSLTYGLNKVIDVESDVDWG